MKTNKLMLATLLACMLGPALAEEAPAGQHKETVTAGPLAMHPGDAGIMINATMLRMHGRIVKNAPYSAQEVMERQQLLADGNQIVNTTTSMSYRDSQGRIRDEHRNRNGEVTAVTISDPVADTTWVLHPQDKSATRLPGATPGRAAAEASRAAAEAGRAAAAAARARIEELRKQGKLPAEGHFARADGEDIIVKRVQRDTGDGLKHVEDHVRILTRELTESRMRELSRLGPMLAGVGDFQWAGKATTRDLGTRDIAGVKAQGKLRSYEIPAGAIGNVKPIVVSDESWWSPDLQITLYSKHSDPRSGENIYRVDNLKREEPAAVLFTVPSDYTVKERQFHRPQPPAAPKAN